MRPEESLWWERSVKEVGFEPEWKTEGGVDGGHCQTLFFLLKIQASVQTYSMRRTLLFVLRPSYVVREKITLVRKEPADYNKSTYYSRITISQLGFFRATWLPANPSSCWSAAIVYRTTLCLRNMCYAPMFVRLSVCPPHAGIVSKRKPMLMIA